jgi:hypothetical protein
MINDEHIEGRNLKQSIQCPVCGDPLSFQIARGRKSGKAFLMLKCLRDGRHFRGFINHRPLVEELIQKLESSKNVNDRKETF